MTTLRLLIALFAAAAICCPMTAIAANSDTDSPAISYYCQTADPLGITYTDSGGRMTRVFVDVVNWTEQGPNGYLAAATPDSIKICRNGEVAQSASPTNENFSILGWRGNSLMFREGSSVRSIDPLTGTQTSSSIGSDVVCIASCPQGYLTIADSGDKVVLMLFDDSGKKLSEWKTKGTCGPKLKLIGNRYAVAEVFAAGGGNDILEKSSLWIVDIQSKSQRTLELKKPLIDFCTGKASSEMLISVARAHDQMLNVTSTALAAVDLRTLKQQAMFTTTGCVYPVGISRGGAWLIATRVYQISGPGRPCRLIAIRLSDQKLRILQENVYECMIDTNALKYENKTLPVSAR